MRPGLKDKFPLMYNALQIQANPGSGQALASINQIQIAPVEHLHHHHHHPHHHDMTLRFKQEFQSETDGENNEALLKLPSTTATSQVGSVAAPLIHSIKMSQELSLEQQQQEHHQHQHHWRPADSPLIRSFSEPVM